MPAKKRSSTRRTPAPVRGATGEEVSPLTQDRLQSQLLALVENIAAARGFGITDSCYNDISNFVARGVQQLDATNSLNDHAQIMTARRTVAKLTERMADEADRLGYAELREDTFGTVKKAICPLYPFC